MGIALENLRQYLCTLEPGPVQDVARCETLLYDAWVDFKEKCGGLTSDKIPGRLEEVEWRPPVLRFTIERHGALKYGSSRAELQDWLFDVERGVASYSSTRYRQLHEKSPPLKTKPLAQQIATLIVTNDSSPQLRWSDNGRCVRLLIGEIIPDEGAKLTAAGRCERLRRDLTDLLKQHGWEEVRPNTCRFVGLP